MEKFTKLEGVAAPLKMINVDTDMIIPKQYLKTIKRTGLGKGLFAEKRYKDDGSENPDFVLNKPAYRNAKILVADDNFGCGSSREHAPWALMDFGIRCVISTSFGDIFYNNCFKNGVLPIKVSPEDLEKLFDDAERGANATLSIDLEKPRNPRAGRRRGEIRDRRVPQALHAQRPRRCRLDHGQEGQDRRLRREGEGRAAVDVRRALATALLLAICAPYGALAEQAKPQDVAVGPVTLQIVETEGGEKELRHGARVLVKDYLVSESLAAKFKDTHARVFDVGPGGNACDGWPAVVTVGKDGTAAIDTTMKGLCSLFAASADEEGFTFVERAVPDQAGSVWRFTPEAGMRRLGLLVFRPQPKTTWNDLEKSLDHPLALFDVAPFDAAVRKLTGNQYNDFTLRLRVAGGVEKKGKFSDRLRLPAALLQLGSGIYRGRSQDE